MGETLPFEMRKREKNGEKRSRQLYYLEIVQFNNILFFSFRNQRTTARIAS